MWFEEERIYFYSELLIFNKFYFIYFL
jgi:hypothetical protein